MAWDTLPSAAALSNLAGLWPFASQFPLAIRERAMAAGASTWPPQTWEYDTGLVETATDNGDGTVTITDSTKAWMTSPHHRWVDPVAGSGGVPTWDWGSFDLVIDAPTTTPYTLSTPDPRLVLHGDLTDQPNATSVKFTLDLTARAAEQVLTAVSDLVGRRYWILRAGGTDWASLFPAAPNAGAYATGLVDSAASGTLTARQLKNVDVLAGVAAADVLYLDGGSDLQRGTLTGVAGNALTYTGTTAAAAVDGRFFVVEPGGVWRWGATGCVIQSAYSGLLGAGYYAHDVTDGTNTAGLPTLTTDVFYGTDPLSCPVVPETIDLHGDPDNDGRDVNYWYPQDNACGTRDTFVNPGIYSCFRGWWSELLGICTSYVPPVADPTDYDGAGSIPTFTAATWFYHAGINGFTGTAGTHSGTSMPCSLGVPRTPTPLWWTIVDDDGSPMISGYTGTYDGSTLNGAFSADHDGKAVVASTGPTRHVPKRVGRFYDVVYFLPDLDGGGSPVSPPTDAHPGTWVTRAKSTHYRVSDLDGVVSDGTLARHEITEDDYVRLAGDCFADPGFPVLVSTSGGADPLAEYHNRAAVGTRSQPVQAAIDAGARGTATGGSTVRLVDAARDWLSVDFYPATNGLTHTFTPDDTAGDGVSCNVTGITIGALWADARFPDFADGPMSTFTAEFEVSGLSIDDPDAVIEKRLITTGTSAGFITWDEPVTITAAPNSARIREPAVLNRWAGIPVRLVRTVAGTVTDDVTVKVTGNHDDTLFLPAVGFTIDEHTTYAIDLPLYGAVYHVESGEYVSTADAGDDPRNPGTNPFLADPTRNLEDHYTESGLPQPNDVTFGMVTGWQELYDAINVLYVTAVGGGSWIETTGNTRTGHYVPQTTFNAWYTGATSGSPPAGDPTDYFDYGLKDSSGPPQRYLDVNKNGSTSFAYGGVITTRVNTLRVTFDAPGWASEIDFYNFADVGAGFDPATDADTVFEDGSDPVTYRAWTYWDTESASGAATQADSARLGAAITATPNIGGPTVLTGTPPTGHRWTGYVVTDWMALRRWTFKFLD